MAALTELPDVRAGAERDEYGSTAVSTCDLCGSDAGRLLFEAPERRFGMPGRFGVVRCRGCGLVRTDPRPEDPGAYYPRGDYYSYSPPARPGSAARARILATYGQGAPGIRARVDRWLAHRMAPGLPGGQPGKILDVGCGSGEFLLGLQEAGWDCHGLDIEAAAVSAAIGAGLPNVRTGDLTHADYEPASFDVVRFWHSLEHVASPRSQLLAARAVLRPNGRIVVGVPNFASALSRATRRNWFYLDLPRHLSHFEPVTLRRLATDNGFEVTGLRIVSTGIPLLGTADYLLGRGERLLDSRAAWYAALPAAITLDTLRLGDALWLEATRGE